MGYYLTIYSFPIYAVYQALQFTRNSASPRRWGLRCPEHLQLKFFVPAQVVDTAGSCVKNLPLPHTYPELNETTLHPIYPFY
jgi:hypothetical protein